MIPIKHPRLDEIAKLHAKFLDQEEKIAPHKQAIIDYINSKSGETMVQSFEELLFANTKKIREIVKKVGEVLKDQNQKEFSESFFNKILEVYDNFSDRKSLFNLFGSKKANQYYSAITMVDTLDVNVCPYCNRSFINTTKKRKEGNYRTCQLDHFFPKSKYPYFALSFYNLIPVCGTCNHLKGENSFGDIPSPYELKRANELVIFKLILKNSNLMNKDSLDIEMEKIHCNYKIDDPIPLASLYKYHNDVAHEIIQKKYIYTDERISELFSSFPDLFESEREVKQLLVGNYLDPDDFNKRPLSKLTHDIMVDVGWLKK
jgi:hypothetical protein